MAVINTSSMRLARFLSLPSYKKVQRFDKITYTQEVGSIRRRRYSQHILKPGDFFGCFVSPAGTTDNGIIIPSSCGEGEYCVFRLGAMLGSSANEMWAVTVQGSKVRDDSTRHLYSFLPHDVDTTKLVRMDDSVRRCFGIHACDIDGGCRLLRNEKIVDHGNRNNKLSTFSILSRREGYPPRCS